MIEYLLIAIVSCFLIDKLVAWVFKHLGNKEVMYSFAVRPTSIGKKKRYKVCDAYTIEGVEVPKDFISDGASIPSFAWRYVGHPYSPEYINIAIAHDYLYSEAIGFYKENYKYAMTLFKRADQWFYSVLRDQNSKVISFIFYIAVRCYSVAYFGFYKRFINKGDK